MKTIASRDNPLFRTLRQLATDAAVRRDARLAILEGVHLCQSFLDSSGTPRHAVVGRSSSNHPEVEALLARLAGSNSTAVELDDRLFASLSGLGQGVALLFVIEQPAPAMPARIETTSVLLDRIQDPGNLGSILRSAAAAGIEDVYASRDCAGAWSPKVLRAGMGAHFHLRVFEECDLVAAIDAASIPCLATSPHADASIFDAPLDREVAWLFGHEGQGVATNLMRMATAVRIPQPGRGESLNVAASAAVCFFEQLRQRRHTG